MKFEILSNCSFLPSTKLLYGTCSNIRLSGTHLFLQSFEPWNKHFCWGSCVLGIHWPMAPQCAFALNILFFDVMETLLLFTFGSAMCITLVGSFPALWTNGTEDTDVVIHAPHPEMLLFHLWQCVFHKSVHIAAVSCQSSEITQRVTMYMEMDIEWGISIASELNFYDWKDLKEMVLCSIF